MQVLHTRTYIQMPVLGLVRKPPASSSFSPGNAPTATSLLGQARNVLQGSHLCYDCRFWGFMAARIQLEPSKGRHGLTEHKHGHCLLICHSGNTLSRHYQQPNMYSYAHVTGWTLRRLRDRRWESPSACAQLGSPLVDKFTHPCQVPLLPIVDQHCH